VSARQGQEQAGAPGTVPKPAIGPYLVEGKPLLCLACGCDAFDQRNATVWAGYFNIPARRLRQVICIRCSFVHWFRR
jgi:hypothetical protein